MVRVMTAVKLVVVCLLASATVHGQTGQAGRDAAVRAFQARLDAYVEIHRRIEGPIPPLEASKDMAEVYRLMSRVRDGIRAERGVRPEPFFTADILEVFGTCVTDCLRREELDAMQADFAEHSPPRLAAPRVGQQLPDDTPIMPVPPRLLAKWPKLPPELRYVIFAKAVLLWDHHADMVVDIAPGVLDPAAYRWSPPQSADAVAWPTPRS